MKHDLQTQLRSNPYTPMKQALRMRILCVLGKRANCSWAFAPTIHQLSQENRYFGYIFYDTDTDAVPIDGDLPLSEEDDEPPQKDTSAISLLSVDALANDLDALQQLFETVAYYAKLADRRRQEPFRMTLSKPSGLAEEDIARFSVWESEIAQLQCKTEYDIAPLSVRILFDDSDALEAYAEKLAYFSGYLGRKHPEAIKTALSGFTDRFPSIDCDRFMEVTSYLGYLLRPEDDDILHMFHWTYRRETIALNTLAILSGLSLFSGKGKTIGESLRDWLSSKEDDSLSTKADIAAVMERSLEEVKSLVCQHHDE